MEYFIDHYAILKVKPDATIEEIKKSFWKLAKEYHPDKGGDPYKFHQLYISYSFLMDSKNRIEYNKIYNKFKKNKFINKVKKKDNIKIIKPENFKYIATLKKFLDKQIQIHKIKKSNRNFLANIQYDYEVELSKMDFEMDLEFQIPVVLIEICKYCSGKDLYCSFCNGLGKHKTEGIIKIFIPRYTIHPGQIIKINLEKTKMPSSYVYPKHNVIRIYLKAKKEFK